MFARSIDVLINLALAAFVFACFGWVISVILGGYGNGFWIGAFLGSILYVLGKRHSLKIRLLNHSYHEQSPR